jgi:3,4-dihydroxy 2-butanone 4-phosphate synthase/GTP cyclohydrolase II
MFNTIEEAIEDIKRGKIIIVIDDEDRENEGDFIMSADLITDSAINFMATHGRGLICTPISAKMAKTLDLNPMVANNNSEHETAFTVSIDAKKNITTGISAADRSYSIKLMLDKKAKPSDFVRPGHIFPLIAKNGGVLKRNGHTEAAVDLSKLAGLNEAGVICEIINEDGTMSRVADLIKLAEKFSLKIITIKDLISYRRKTEFNLKFIEDINFPTKFGEFRMSIFSDPITNEEHMAIYKGELLANTPLVRVHSKCVTGDTFGSLRCDCGEQLESSLKDIETNGAGILVYLDQEGRGIGLSNKIKAYKLQESGLDTIEANEKLGFHAELRDFAPAAQIIKYFQVNSVNLLTNNPLKVNELIEYGIDVEKRIPLEMDANKFNMDYLKTKKNKMNHYITLQ